ncbi:MAG: DUF1559 domain-containing protein, partial [Pirellulales bacterium]
PPGTFGSYLLHQAAREAGRRSQCANHMKQLSLGCMNYEGTHKFFPSGGWGWRWVGDADRSVGAEQPGSWLYNILPFVEEQALYDMPSDGQSDLLGESQLIGARQMVYEPAPAVFHCPSRRPAITYKIEAHHPDIAVNAKRNEEAGDFYVGAADYAANAGDGIYLDADAGGAPNWAQGKSKTGRALYRRYMDTLGLQTIPSSGAQSWICTGIMFQESEVGLGHISDGASKTYLLGERYLNPLNYFRDLVNDDGSSTVEGGDDWGWAWGYCDDNSRSGKKLPLADFPNVSDKEIFGSAHAGGWHVAFCDGSVQAISYDIDLLVHQNNANRRDSGETKTR